MPDETNPTASGFRSLVQQIQEKDTGADEDTRPPRRRLSLRRDPRRAPPAEAPIETANTKIDPTTRLLQRRWL